MNTPSFSKGAKINQGIQSADSPFHQYRVPLKAQHCQERELSPWSSEEYRTIRTPIQEFSTFNKGMAKFTSKNHHRGVRGGSVELKPLRDIYPEKISKDFFDLLKYQKKEPILLTKPNKISKLPLHRVQMSLGLQSSAPMRYKKSQNIQLQVCDQQSFYEIAKEQPVRVKIAKKMKERIRKNEQQEQRILSDRTSFYETVVVDNRDKTNGFKIKQSLRLRDIKDNKLQFPNVEWRSSNIKLSQNQIILKGDPMRVTVKHSKKHRTPYSDQTEKLMQNKQYYN